MHKYVFGFSQQDVNKISAVGLPMMRDHGNHIDVGMEQVGKWVHSWSDAEGNRHSLGYIDVSTMHGYNTAMDVLTGKLGELSLAHHAQVTKSDDGSEMNVLKIPYEISVVKEGYRANTVITNTLLDGYVLKNTEMIKMLLNGGNDPTPFDFATFEQNYSESHLMRDTDLPSVSSSSALTMVSGSSTSEKPTTETPLNLLNNSSPPLNILQKNSSSISDPMTIVQTQLPAPITQTTSVDAINIVREFCSPHPHSLTSYFSSSSSSSVFPTNNNTVLVQASTTEMQNTAAPAVVPPQQAPAVPQQLAAPVQQAPAVPQQQPTANQMDTLASMQMLKASMQGQTPEQIQATVLQLGSALVDRKAEYEALRQESAKKDLALQQLANNQQAFVQDKNASVADWRTQVANVARATGKPELIAAADTLAAEAHTFSDIGALNSMQKTFSVAVQAANSWKEKALAAEQQLAQYDAETDRGNHKRAKGVMQHIAATNPFAFGTPSSAVVTPQNIVSSLLQPPNVPPMNERFVGFNDHITPSILAQKQQDLLAQQWAQVQQMAQMQQYQASPPVAQTPTPMQGIVQQPAAVPVQQQQQPVVQQQIPSGFAAQPQATPSPQHVAAAMAAQQQQQQQIAAQQTQFAQQQSQYRLPPPDSMLANVINGSRHAALMYHDAAASGTQFDPNSLSNFLGMLEPAPGTKQ